MKYLRHSKHAFILSIVVVVFVVVVAAYNITQAHKRELGPFVATVTIVLLL